VKLLLLLLHVKLCVYVHCSDEQLSEMGKARGIYGVVRNAYRMWSENIKGYIRNLSGRILIHVHVRVCARTHTCIHSQYISVHSSEAASVV